jgi:aminopeptidase YwaD
MKENYAKYAESAIKLTAEIIEKHGPRVSGTKGNLSACSNLETILSKYSTSTKQESFGIHPDSLFAIGKIFTVIYLIGFIAIMIDSKISLGIGLLCMVIGTVYFITQFILYLDTFDGLFKKVVGNNIIGIVEPKNAVDQQVIIVSHHDSSPVYPFYEKAPLLFTLRLFVPVLLFLICLLVLITIFWFSILSMGIQSIPIWIKYILLFGVVPVLPMFGYISKRESPGAGDNLIGCAIGIKLAEIFQNPENVLQNTRIVVLLTDGEEVGQKGAKFFIKNNQDLLKKTKTVVINIDSIYEYEDIAVVSRDRNGFTRLSSDLLIDIKTVATDLGHAFKTISIPFGGGGTDGGQFARDKIKTINIIGTPTNAFRKEIIFHTMKDNPDKISQKAVSAVIEVVSEYLKKNDIIETNSYM